MKWMCRVIIGVLCVDNIDRLCGKHAVPSLSVTPGCLQAKKVSSPREIVAICSGSQWTPYVSAIHVPLSS